MAKSDQKFDPAEEEVETYDVSKFKDLKPEDLNISESTKKILNNIEKVFFFIWTFLKNLYTITDPLTKSNFKMKCITFQSDGKKWFYPTTIDEALSLSKQFPKAVFRQGGTGMCSIKIKEPSPTSDSPPIFTSIGQGLRFVYSNQIVFSALSLDMFAVLFGGAVISSFSYAMIFGVLIGTYTSIFIASPVLI